jgi:cysteinyl-tRNA synthetase, unknown class
VKHPRRPRGTFGLALSAPLLCFCVLVGGCAGGSGDDGDGGGGGGGSIAFSAVDDFAYQLQGLDLAQAGASAFDLIITDYSLDGTEDTRLSAGQVSALQSSPGGPKRVLAYMSIGEAEDYRWYWQTAWDANADGTPDAGAPSWLGPSNPDWPGNYKVRYWDPAWQAVIFGSATSYLDKIIAAGFDGVYLDIVDAYEYWGPGGDSGLDRASAEEEMVAFVETLAHYARVTKGHADSGVFPQNGDGLAAHPDYVATVTGIGREDLWYMDNAPQPTEETDAALANLDIFRAAGKLVLVTDYVTQSALIDDLYAKAHAKGYVPYATVRDLDALTVNVGHAPD